MASNINIPLLALDPRLKIVTNSIYKINLLYSVSILSYLG